MFHGAMMVDVQPPIFVSDTFKCVSTIKKAKKLFLSPISKAVKSSDRVTNFWTWIWHISKEALEKEIKRKTNSK